jgi:hypothetical protein
MKPPGEFVTITRHGKTAAVRASPEAVEAAKRASTKDRPSLVNHLQRFPADIDLDDEILSRNRMPSREIDLGAAGMITPQPSTARDA